MHFVAAAGNQPAIYHMNTFQAIVLGIIQGIFELFPLSSLGHAVLIPSWIGGSWATLVQQESRSESPYLAFIVGLHLANAVVLLLFYIREWARLIVGFVRSVVRRRIETDIERLAWLIVIATVPVGILGLALEHTFRTIFAKPSAAAAFLCLNGLILAAGEWFRRRSPAGRAVPDPDPEPVMAASAPVAEAQAGRLSNLRDDHLVALDSEAEARLSRQLTVWSAIWIGAAQSLALLAGISREGVAMVGGLYRGLSNENALRFAFLLSTPVILAAGVLKVPDLLGPLGSGIRGQVVAGSIAAVVASVAAILFLTRYFKTRTLVPFAVYSVLFGLASLIRFAVF
ncbi:MAG: undecaprenyl-diphosphate phosphatase [Acidimicrobiales bacterium]|nr:undecaprenyl-diphosphate phosphatase [Acidimicrobiales bacterium]